MVLKRVVYGVDKNPMAVELAKVALWLHSFTVGAPLSFLDHHLRCGDSVIGAWSRPTVELLKARGALFNTGAIASVERVARVMESIEEKTDSDIAEVTASKTAFGIVEEATAPIAAFFSVLTAERLMGIFDGAPKKAPPAPEKMVGKSEKQLATWREQVRAFEAASAFGLALEGTFGDPVKIAAGETQIAPPELVEQLALLPADDADAAIEPFSKNRHRRPASRIGRSPRDRGPHTGGASPFLSLGDRLPERLVEPALGGAEGRLRRGDRKPALRAPGTPWRRGEASLEGRLWGLRRHGRPLRLFL